MYDAKQYQFFTDPDTSKDEKNSKIGGDSSSDDEENGDSDKLSMGSGEVDAPINLGAESKLSLKKNKEESIDYHRVEVLTEQQKEERTKKIHSKVFMKFPTNSGISGVVFKSKELYFSNNASKETKFVEEIDNQSGSSSDVKNFMIGPVFGSRDSEIPCAIIQFINKLDPQGKGKIGMISKSDELKFATMQSLLGMCIENTNEMSTTIKMSFDVKDVMKNIQDKANEKINDTGEIISELSGNLKEIKEQH